MTHASDYEAAIRAEARAAAFAEAADIARGFEWWKHATVGTSVVHKRIAEAIDARAVRGILNAEAEQ